MRRLHLIIALFILACAGFYPMVSQAQRGAGETLAPERIRSTWGKRLNPTGAIPDSGFKAIYFDRRNPGDVVFQEDVTSIAIKYAWNDFHGIDSPNFAGYWVGKVRFRRATTQQISISQSWAKSRVIIDGEIVYDGGEASVVHDFTAGEHVVEVEYVNNWHTTEFKVTIGDVVAPWTEQDVARYFRSNAGSPAELYYVGLYESGEKDTSVTVSLPLTSRPVVLWLASYEAIDWRIASNNAISTIVLSSFQPGSRVSGVTPGELIPLKGWHSIHRETRQCSCVAGSFHCQDNRDLGDVAQKLRQVTGLDLSGYATQYSASALTVTRYGRELARKIEQAKAAELAAEKQCRLKADPNFDEMMN